MNIQQLKQWLGNNLRYGEQTRRVVELPLLQKMTVGLVMPEPGRVFGIDVSHWNPAPVDFQRMKDLYHLDFAIIKGADGTVTSRYFRENIASVKAAGIPWGMYVWLYPNNKVSITTQVNAWRALEAELVPPLGVFIDCEWTTFNGLPANPVTADLRMAHDKYFALSGTHATTYTARGYADTYLKGFDWTHEPLWIANYGVTSPLLPIGATTYQFWQFTSTLDGWALDPTGNLELDGNYYNGTHAEFAAKYGAVIPPPTGDIMRTWKCIYAAGLKVRSGNNINSSQVQSLALNDKVEGTWDTTTGWINISKIIRVNGTALLPATPAWWCSGLPTYMEEVLIVPPPPATFAHTLDVTLDGVVVYHKDFN